MVPGRSGAGAAHPALGRETSLLELDLRSATGEDRASARLRAPGARRRPGGRRRRAGGLPAAEPDPLRGAGGSLGHAQPTANPAITSARSRRSRRSARRTVPGGGEYDERRRAWRRRRETADVGRRARCRRPQEAQRDVDARSARTPGQRQAQPAEEDRERAHQPEHRSGRPRDLAGVGREQHHRGRPAQQRDQVDGEEPAPPEHRLDVASDNHSATMLNSRCNGAEVQEPDVTTPPPLAVGHQRRHQRPRRNSGPVVALKLPAWPPSREDRDVERDQPRADEARAPRLAPATVAPRRSAVALADAVDALVPDRRLAQAVRAGGTPAPGAPEPGGRSGAARRLRRDPAAARRATAAPAVRRVRMSGSRSDGPVSRRSRRAG